MAAVRPVSVTPFRRIPSTDRDLNLVQAHLADVIRSIGDRPRLLQGVQLLSGVNLVSHGLGANYVSYWLGNYDTSVDIKPVFNDGAGNPIDRRKFVGLQATAPVTVDVLVF